MLNLEGLRWSGAALLVALLAAPEAATAGGRAASTRSDGGVSSRGASSGGSGSSTASRASSGGRVAVPRGSGSTRSGGSTSSSGAGARTGSHDVPRVAVPRVAGDDGGRPDRTGGRHTGGSHSGGGSGRTIVIGGWADPWFYGPHWGFWGSWWWPWGPAMYRDYGYGYYRERGGEYDEGYGALDTDIWPEETEIWIDGERIGTADDFDGFPSFLWLPHGTYDVVFYMPGFRTLARQYSIYSGVIVDVEDRLERGEAVRPEDLPATSTVNREAREQRNRERQEAARAREEWRERRDRRPAPIEDEVDDEYLDDEVENGDLPVAGAGETVARLHLRVTPDDASVYLDGNFLGTGREMEQLSAGMVMAPGNHLLQVVRPGYESQDVSFDSDAGEALELRVDLDRD